MAPISKILHADLEKVRDALQELKAAQVNLEVAISHTEEINVVVPPRRILRKSRKSAKRI